MFEDSITDEVRSKYILLELDTFYFPEIQKNRTAYCLVEHTPVMEMFSVDQYLDLHNNLVKNFQKGNWKFCEDALEHLKGRWNGELDSFYDVIAERVAHFKVNDPGEKWDGVILANG